MKYAVARGRASDPPVGRAWTEHLTVDQKVGSYPVFAASRLLHPPLFTQRPCPVERCGPSARSILRPAFQQFGDVDSGLSPLLN